MTTEINIKVGSTYPIQYVIEELKKHPDIRLGHILALNNHGYYLGVTELKIVQKEIVKAEKDGLIVYDIDGKKKIKPSDITILGILDPYTKYARYDRFYEELYKYIEKAINVSSSGAVQVLQSHLLDAVKNDEFSIEKEDDFFGGMTFYFHRRDIESQLKTKVIYEEKTSGVKTKPKIKEKKKYVLFRKQDPVLSQLIDFEIFEKYNDFYEELYKHIEKSILVSSSGAVQVFKAYILSAARNEELVIEKEYEFFSGMSVYFSRKGIKIKPKDKYILFRK